MYAHITNTAYQDLDPNFREEDCIYVWDEDSMVPLLLRDKTCKTRDEAQKRVRDVLQKMQDITGELFRAYKTEFGVFSPIEGCFEHYGLDFVVDDNWQVFLLEVNPGPDFKQTGGRLSKVIKNLMGDTIDAALIPLLPTAHPQTTTPNKTGRLHLVYNEKSRGGGAQDKISMTLT
jgi:hypothetical protein